MKKHKQRQLLKLLHKIVEASPKPLYKGYQVVAMPIRKNKKFIILENDFNNIANFFNRAVFSNLISKTRQNTNLGRFALNTDMTSGNTLYSYTKNMVIQT